MGFVVVAGFHHIPLAQYQRRRVVVPAVLFHLHRVTGGRYGSSSSSSSSSSDNNSSWSDNDPSSSSSSSSSSSPSSSSSSSTPTPPRFVGGWDDEDDLDYAKATQKKRSASKAQGAKRRSGSNGNNNKSFINRNNNNNRFNRAGGGPKNFSRGGGGSFRGNNNNSYGYQQQQQQQQLDPNRINMKLLEQEAGFDHLYGIAPVLNALKAGRRDFFTPYEYDEARSAKIIRRSARSDDDDEDDEDNNEENYDDDDDDDDGDDQEEDNASSRRDESSLRPEAQTRPCLFVQAESSSSSESSSTTTTMRSAEKAEAVAKALYLAENMKLPIAYVDKGILNTLSNNRPHQGLVLRCGKLKFETFRTFLDNSPGRLGRVDHHHHQNFWLVLDQIVDPQNFGALIRTAEFLAVPSILVCAKHAAPASAVVSAASAGALEGTNVRIYSTPSLPRALATAKAAGDTTIVGATSNLPMNYDAQLYELDEFPVEILRPPNELLRHATLLVLGSEGSGLRFSVAKSCTHFCRIPGGVDAVTTTGGGGTVDSLNVSVSAGIFLWHFLRILKLQQHPPATDDDAPTITTSSATPSKKGRKKV